MRILVTGGSGFLGSHLIPQLVAAGHEVVALALSTSDVPTLSRLGATPVVGDLASGELLALPPLDAVIHGAARFRFAGPRAPYFATNVEGTRGLLHAAEPSGARTFVHISAAAVVMDDSGSAVHDADESAPTFPNSFSGYIASKSRAEALVLAADRPGFRTIVLRPPGLWGPGDLFSTELPGAIASGRFAFIDRGNYPFATAHVDNLVEAVERALDHGRGGRAYFIRDPEVGTFRDLVALIAGTQGVSIDGVRSIPYRPAFLMGHLMEIGARLTGRKEDPPLSRSLVRMIGREFTINDAAARRALGYVGRTSREQARQMYLEAAEAAKA